MSNEQDPSPEVSPMTSDRMSISSAERPTYTLGQLFPDLKKPKKKIITTFFGVVSK